MAVAGLIILLFVVLGICDLVVGVSNNSVNFLNSAIGSKVASRRTILWLAAGGLLVGAVFSSGMMSLARSSVVYPQNFTFYDMIAVFTAVMVVHILLIDVLNSYGIPTSTTTSLIFQLIGGALAIALVKSTHQGGFVVGDYVDTGHVFMIMEGLFVSVVVAFVLGCTIQFLLRLVFTFNYRERLGWMFSLAGAFAVTVILYLIFKEALYTQLFKLGVWDDYLKQHLPEVLLSIFVLVFFVFFVAIRLFNIDVPRWIVFFGTFALSMSFASKDLVNFIGVPMSAIESTWAFLGSSESAGTFTLESLNGPALQMFPPWVYLVVFVVSAGIMSLALLYSRKAQTVIETEMLLERQEAGNERFGPTSLSRTVVRQFINLGAKIGPFFPKRLLGFVNSRFQRSATVANPKYDSVPYFDMVRASVNLTVASIIILAGTWLRLPLSTTFIVFMVSMGTSLADGAWGRDNAVYRLSGVFTVLGSWVLATCIAVLGAFVLTLIIWYGGSIAIVAVIGLAMLALRKSWLVYVKRTSKTRETSAAHSLVTIGSEGLLDSGSEHFRKQLLEASKIFFLTIQGFVDEDEATLVQAKAKAEGLVEQVKTDRNELFHLLKCIPDQSIESGHCYVQALDYVFELANCLNGICGPILLHVQNNHKGLSAVQKEEMGHLVEEITTFFNHLVHIEKEQRLSLLEEPIRRQQLLMDFLDELRKNHIKRIRSGDSKTRVSLLYLDVLSETKNVILFSLNIIKSHRDFVGSLPSLK